MGSLRLEASNLEVSLEVRRKLGHKKLSRPSGKWSLDMGQYKDMGAGA